MRALIAQRAGLNATDAECIDYLLSNAPCTAGDLARVTGLSKSTITSALKRIEKAGYIIRRISPADRRVALIHPNLPLIQGKFGPYYKAVTVEFQKITDTYSTEELKFLAKHYNSMTRLYDQQVALLSDAEYRGN
jgi:predicted transcriptional regulator